MNCLYIFQREECKEETVSLTAVGFVSAAVVLSTALQTKYL